MAEMMMVKRMTRARKDRMLMMGLAAKALPCVLPPLEQLQLRPPPARAHKSFNGCAAQLPLITASAATLQENELKIIIRELTQNLRSKIDPQLRIVKLQ